MSGAPAVRLLSKDQLLALGAERGVARATIQSASGRQLLVVQAGERGFFVLDSFCHHMGASLADGAVIDIEDEAVLVCPAHRRKICLRTGELLEDVLDETNGRCNVARRGVTQRMHACEMREDGLWAEISNPTDDRGIASDKYNLPIVGMSIGPRVTGRLGFQARKQRATTAVASKLGLSPRTPLAPADASLAWHEEDLVELTPPQPQPSHQPAKQPPAKRTIIDYFGAPKAQVEVQVALAGTTQSEQQWSLPGSTADDPMDVS